MCGYIRTALRNADQQALKMGSFLSTTHPLVLKTFGIRNPLPEKQVRVSDKKGIQLQKQCFCNVFTSDILTNTCVCVCICPRKHESQSMSLLVTAWAKKMFIFLVDFTTNHWAFPKSLIIIKIKPFIWKSWQRLVTRTLNCKILPQIPSSHSRSERWMLNKL